jgi:alpha-ribazole phosphatase
MRETVMRSILRTWIEAGGEKKILLLRHGQILEPKGGRRFVGQTDLSLTDTGRRQAQYWRECLAEVPLAAVISSDLSRCMQTARIVADGRGMQITALADLREIQLGQWDGLTFRLVREKWPDAFQERGKAVARFRPPAGESFLDLQKRVVPAFEQAVDQSGQCLLIVAHAGVIRVVLCHILGMPVDHLFRIGQAYGALNLIDRQAGGYRLHALNLLPDPGTGGSSARPASAGISARETLV